VGTTGLRYNPPELLPLRRLTGDRVSEKITHPIIMDDSFRLMLASESLCPALVESATRRSDFARLGSGTRPGDRHSVVLLTELRKCWPNENDRERLEARQAFVR
jgi:hypothetical protein